MAVWDFFRDFTKSMCEHACLLESTLNILNEFRHGMVCWQHSCKLDSSKQSVAIYKIGRKGFGAEGSRGSAGHVPLPSLCLHRQEPQPSEAGFSAGSIPCCSISFPWADLIEIRSLCCVKIPLAEPVLALFSLPFFLLLLVPITRTRQQGTEEKSNMLWNCWNNSKVSTGNIISKCLNAVSQI